ncbi:hypothetical protein PCC7424_3977 [Gloeothece citriformis PCC 7424]|uniref:Uncharacterized protein n=1 Tax=Gloeothece citriformis (strain PCC 7424) TaxID=65393 RepID=B7KKL8_GLOC7|nr:hypothetical protein [Gloeothece citriformis]ACK72351.1 hypothetical protein PCC7424_3977 [Gloeothece citriformis PCC 7424]
MKTLPDEQTLLTLLDDLKNAEEKAREICEMSKKIALKYQKKCKKLVKKNPKVLNNLSKCPYTIEQILDIDYYPEIAS